MNNGNDKREVAKVIAARADDILFFIKNGVTTQQYKEIISVLNKASNSSQDLNTNNNIIMVMEYMKSNNVSAQEAFDKIAAKGFSKHSYVEVTPQRKEEIRGILQRSSYNTQQRLKPYLDDSIQIVSNYMDQYNLSAQDAINKLMADADQEAVQSNLKEWGSAAAKKCQNKIYDLENAWTSGKGLEIGACYPVTVNIFQKISANRVLSKIIVFSDYKFKLIYLVSGKSITNGENLLVVPTKDFKYQNIVGYNKEINGFRVIQQQ